MSRPTIKPALKTIKEELDWWEPKLISKASCEAQRLRQRTMLHGNDQGDGFLPRHRELFKTPDGKKPGEPPPTLLDYLPRDTLIVIDESHQSVPQVRGMFEGDQSRKRTLVEYGFRLPSALDFGHSISRSLKPALVRRSMCQQHQVHTS